MKFQCPQCKKEFSLETSRLQPGVVRIRCTSCGSVIKMRIGNAPAPSQETRSTEQAAVTFWAVIGQSKVGPIPFPALRRLIQEQKITRSTLLWNKNLTTWTRASHISEVAALLPKDGSAEPSGAKPLPAQDLPPPIAPAQVVSPGHSAPAVATAVPPSASPALGAAPAAVPKREQASVGSAPAGVPAAAKSPAPPVPPPRKSPVPGARTAQPQEDEAFFPSPIISSGPAKPLPGKGLDEEAMFPSSAQVPAHRPGQGRNFDVLDIPDGDVAVRVEAGQARGAQDSLRDFSMMVRLSAESRKRTIVLTIGIILFLIVAGVVVALFATSGRNEPDSKKKAPDDEEFIGAASGFSKAKVQDTVPSNSADIKSERLVVPAGGATLELNPTVLQAGTENLEFQFAMGANAPDTDEIQIRAIKPDDAKKPAGTKQPRPIAGQGEVSLTQLATESGSARSKSPEGLAAASAQRAANPDQEAEVVPTEAPKAVPTGAGLVRTVKIALGKRLKASRRAIQSCASRHGLVDTQVTMNLHISEGGTVTSLTIDGGSEGAEQCMLAAFEGWTIPEVERRLMVPITISF